MLQAVKLIAEIRVGKIERDDPVCLWSGQLEQLLAPLQLPVIMGAVLQQEISLPGDGIPILDLVAVAVWIFAEE